MSRLKDEPLFMHVRELWKVQPCLVNGGPSPGTQEEQDAGKRGRHRDGCTAGPDMAGRDPAQDAQRDILIRAD